MNKANLIQQKPEAINTDQDMIINKNSHSFNASDGSCRSTTSSTITKTQSLWHQICFNKVWTGLSCSPLQSASKPWRTKHKPHTWFSACVDVCTASWAKQRETEKKRGGQEEMWDKLRPDQRVQIKAGLTSLILISLCAFLHFHTTSASKNSKWEAPQKNIEGLSECFFLCWLYEGTAMH